MPDLTQQEQQIISDTAAALKHLQPKLLPMTASIKERNAWADTYTRWTEACVKVGIALIHLGPTNFDEEAFLIACGFSTIPYRRRR